MRQSRPLALLMTGVVIVVPVLSSRTLGAQASPPPRHALTGQTPAAVVRGTATPRGHHHPHAVLTLRIGLGVPNAAALDALIAAASNRASPQYGHYLTRAQYLAQVAPTAQQVQAVQAWATGAGLAVRAVSPERLYVTVQGTTSQVEHALGVTINDYSLPDRSFFANDRDPTVPSGLGIRAISGLTTIARFQVARHPQDLRFNCDGQFDGCYLPSDFQAAYGASRLSDGSGQTIALTLWGAPVPQSDLDGFTSAVNSSGASLPALVSGQAGADGIDWIGVNGNNLTFVDAPGYTNALGEAAMDVEYVHGVAPHSHLKYYLANMLYYPPLNDYFPDEGGLLEAADAAANDPSVHIVSNSWGGLDATLDDPAFVSNYDAVLQFAASVGTTFYFSSGDQGYVSGARCRVDVNNCTTAMPAYPAESSYVVAVGGTTLLTNADASYNQEAAWSGSGGGCTTAFAAPWWQTGTGTAPCTTASGRPGRTIPDIAADADPNTGALVYVQGGTWVIGGTSLAAPLWAGFAADIDHYLSANGQPLMGFAAPVLYQLAADPATYGRDLHDVRSGANDPTGGLRGYAASPGYDEATGWGSPAVDNLGADWTAGPGMVQTAVAQQTATAVAQQTATAQAQQTATAQAQQTATAVAQQTALAQATATTAAQQTAAAAAQQTATAALAQQTASAQATATAAAQQTASVQAQQTAVAQATAMAATQQTAAAAAQQTASARAQQSVVAQQTASAQQTAAAAAQQTAAAATATAAARQMAAAQQTATAQAQQTAQARQSATVQAQQTATAQARPTNTPVPPTRTPMPPRKPVLKVLLPLRHGRLAGNSVLTLSTQTRPRASVTIVLTLIRWSGRKAQISTASVQRPLYRAVLHTRSDATGHVVARVRLAYNPAHTIQGTLSITAQTTTGTASRVIGLTLVHANVPRPRHVSGRP